MSTEVFVYREVLLKKMHLSVFQSCCFLKVYKQPLIVWVVLLFVSILLSVTGIMQVYLVRNSYKANKFYLKSYNQNNLLALEVVFPSDTSYQINYHFRSNCISIHYCKEHMLLLSHFPEAHF